MKLRSGNSDVFTGDGISFYFSPPLLAFTAQDKGSSSIIPKFLFHCQAREMRSNNQPTTKNTWWLVF
jgi:hypothetical protein